MYFKTCATLGLATGLAAAKPISLPSHSPRQLLGSPNNNFNFIDGFNLLNARQQILNIQSNNLQVVDNGFQQAIVQQAQEVLVINEQNNGFNNNLNNLFRKSNFKNNFPDQSTVMLVVQEIQVAVDNGFGGRVEQSVFAQSVLIANRGLGVTRTVMVVSQETLIAQNILNNGVFENNNNFNNGFDNQNVVFPTATADFQLFGARPTWSTIAADPAATLGAIWQAELDDLNKIDFNQNDNDLNNRIAEEEKRALDEAKRVEEEQRKAEEEARKQEEQQQQEEEQQQQEQQQQDEQRKAEGEEAKRLEEEQRKAEEEAAKRQQEQEQQGDEKADAEQVVQTQVEPRV
ncbi:hypothetical protein M011DRAFT_489295 [Sporormia fimetaria CBS 119925]|uniref:Uncharacterized protein n=1 Tax=Sporormia fimetaria CBS 119925 TaxID=1340428 RepID=A0A6A6V229_9PLEO|nr:hypothetical protein M011DRAFT_489295 [Sporormia fimetaria CBS 119925]